MQRQTMRATGSCASAKVGGRRPRKIVGDHEAWLLEQIGFPLTLRGLFSELAARGLSAQRSSHYPRISSTVRT